MGKRRDVQRPFGGYRIDVGAGRRRARLRGSVPGEDRSRCFARRSPFPGATQVHPRRGKKTRRIGMGIPMSHRPTQPAAPFWLRDLFCMTLPLEFVRKVFIEPRVPGEPIPPVLQTRDGETEGRDPAREPGRVPGAACAASARSSSGA